MELGAFTGTLRQLSVTEIRTLAADLRSDTRSAEEEITAMRAMLAIDGHLHGVVMRNRAALAARDAAALVQRAALAEGVGLPDDDVTCVARAAAVIARGIVAGSEADREVQLLSQPWSRVVVGTLAAA